MTLATPVGPLPQWGDHVSVLRAFWLLYRQPAEFRKCWEGLPTGQSLWAAVRLSSHLGFYLFLLSVAFNWLVQFLIPVLWRFSFQVGWMDAKPKNAWITLVFTTLVYTVVAWLELWRWRRPGNDDGAAVVERWGTDELQSARRILYRRVGWLFALPLLLLLAFSLQAETGDRVVRQVQALLTVYAPLVALELAVWLARARRRSERPTLFDRSRATEQVAQRVLLYYLPLSALLFLHVHVFLDPVPLPSPPAEVPPGGILGLGEEDLASPLRIIEAAWRIIEAAFEGVLKGMVVALIAGAVVAWAAGTARGIALGFVGAACGGIALGTTARNAPTWLLILGLCVALIYPLLAGGTTERSSVWRLPVVILSIVAVTVIGAMIEARVMARDYVTIEGLIRGLGLGLVLGLCRGAAEAVIRDRRMSIPLGLLGGVIVGAIAGLSAAHPPPADAYYFKDPAFRGVAAGSIMGIAYLFGVYRLYNHAFHLRSFLWPSPASRRYRGHPVAWDDLCSVAFPGLYRLLVAYAEEEPAAAEAEIQRLIETYSSQKMQALLARAMLLTRESGRVSDLARLENILARLPDGDTGFLRETPQLREMIGEIVRLQALLRTIDRPVFREPTARELCTKIENFRYRVDGFQEPWSSEFRAASAGWIAIARRQLSEAQAVLDKEAMPQVFRAGDPVDRHREAFVPRNGVIGDLVRQLRLGDGCPGIVLYGRRRIGKSTVLKNLTGFLPERIIPLTLSMQNPEAFTSFLSFVGLLGRRLRECCPGVPPDGGPPRDLSALFGLLSDCDAALEVGDRRVLIAIDEYEFIDSKIADRVFPADFLNLVRESIQSHRRLTWVFAGSHEITQLTHAPWTSSLVSARTIEVPMFTAEETWLLLTEPLKHSGELPGGEDRPPHSRYSAEFWGEGTIDRIHGESGGWPHLVQLIAETVVDILNDEKGERVDAGLLEKALNQAAMNGQNVMVELLMGVGESRDPREWDYLSGFRRRETQPIPDDEAVGRSLRRRLLVVEEGDRMRLRVPLMLRWLHLCC